MAEIHENHLIKETSPYLLQHAHNPVKWYAWREEAFEEARRTGKPILVSIGYSTCHWCHVMERESFEDEEVASVMNEHFINIKVDREERPDVDQAFMAVCQILTGQGGWPLNCFLTTDKRPFLAGTYYPPRPAYNRPSWMQLILHVAQVYANKREEVENQADRIEERLSNTASTYIQSDILQYDAIDWLDYQKEVFTAIQRQFDATEGGIGGAPKFPMFSVASFLFYHYHITGSSEALAHNLLTLDKMLNGGIYDHLGGGLARYATDNAWLVPHFEKMLYDNALLIKVLADAWSITKKELYLVRLKETIEFVNREMSHPEGGFYAALDADSEGEEGKYYVWNYAELEEILGEDLQWYAEHYGLKPEGNWEHGKNILWIPEPVKGPSPSAEKISACNRILLEHRTKRIRPGLDHKIILSWNGLMIKAFAKAFQATGEIQYKNRALKAARFIRQNMKKQDGSYYRIFTSGKADHQAFLDDYAYVMEAWLALYELTGEPFWIEEAVNIMELLDREFKDEQDELYFFSSRSQTDLPNRRKDLYDNEMPSANAVIAQLLMRLGLIKDRAHWRESSSRMLNSMRDGVKRYPASFSRWAEALLEMDAGLNEIVIVGEGAVDAMASVMGRYWPNKLVMASEREDDNYPLLSKRTAGKRRNYFVCKDYACLYPVDNEEEMWSQIELA